MNTKEYRASLLEAFVIKSTVKQQVYNNTAESFLILKKVLKQLEKDYIKVLKGQIPDRNLPYYQEKGPFEMEFKIGGDLLFFSMHSNVLSLTTSTLSIKYNTSLMSRFAAIAE
jgi:hypothetical protein